MRDKLQSEELQSAHTDMNGLSLKTKSPQVTFQNIPAENTDVPNLPTHKVNASHEGLDYLNLDEKNKVMQAVEFLQSSI